MDTMVSVEMFHDDREIFTVSFKFNISQLNTEYLMDDFSSILNYIRSIDSSDFFFSILTSEVEL